MNDFSELESELRKLCPARPSPELFGRLRRAETIGRPLGGEAFIAELERLTHRTLKPAKRGPKPSAPEKTRGMFAGP